MNNSLVSVIVTTKNNQQTLEACLFSIQEQTYEAIEIVVVDNFSTDKTVEIARQFTHKVWVSGPERCQQRNFAAQKATGRFIAIIDSDMILSAEVIEECVAAMQADAKAGGVIIPEESFGQGFWAQCKRLERSFYVGVDWIEAARFFERQAFIDLGGYNESLVSGEDWELSQRMAARGKIAHISAFIHHDEGHLRLLSTLRKKFYYAGKFTEYTQTAAATTATHGTQPSNIVLKRFGLYFAQPAKLLKNPFVGVGMLTMKVSEFGFGAAGYALAKVKNRRQVQPQKDASSASEDV